MKHSHKICKGGALLLLLAMLVQLLPALPIAARETAAPDTKYITDGLVSLFEGGSHGEDDTVWEDLAGENDITGLVANPDTGVGWTGDGWHVVDSKHEMPTALLDVLKGEEYSFEMVLGDVTLHGSTYATFIANNGGLTSEKFCLYYQPSYGKFFAKASGLARASGCPTIAGESEKIVANSTITVTFRAGGQCNLYQNGKLMSSAAAPFTNENTQGTTLAFGEDDPAKTSDTLFKGFRFYSKALSAGEVASNYAVDGGGEPTYTKTLRGDYITDGLVSLFNGVGHAAKDTTWEDEWGENDIIGLTPDEGTGVGFEAEGWRSVKTKHKLPLPLLEAVSGEEFTLEVRLGDITEARETPSSGNNYITFLYADQGDTNSEKLAFYVQTKASGSEDPLDILYFKTSGVDTADRPKVETGGRELAENSTISLTYKSSGKVTMYVDGEQVAQGSAPAKNANADVLSDREKAEFVFGNSLANRDSNTLYKGFRFYTRELSALEVAHNVAADATIQSEGGQKETDYVSDGLVSLFTGAGHDAAETTWEDAWGNNPISNLPVDDDNHFTEEGFQISGKQAVLPGNLLSVLKGSEFTVEVALGDLAVLDAATNRYIPILSNLATEVFSLYVQTEMGTMDKLILKTSGIASADRPTVADGGLELAKNSTLSVTFRAGGQVCLYVDGALVAQANAPATNGNNASGTGDLVIGNENELRLFRGLYKGMRFYRRALTAGEVAMNSYVDNPALKPALEYVDEGLVSLYDGEKNTFGGHDAASTTWYDLKGENHIMGLPSGASHFTDDAYHVEKTQHSFPSALLNLVNGNAFTVEMVLGEVTPVGGSYTTFLNTAGNDSFALFLRLSDNTLELKTSSSTTGRAKVSDGKNLVQNATVTVTFEVGKEAKIYVSGHPLATGDAKAAIGGTAPLIFGNETSSKTHSADYKGFRFYNRALTEEEVIANATTDGTYDPDMKTVKEYVQVAQPDTGIIGDITFSEPVESKAALTALTTAEVKPANLIFYMGEDLQATDASGENPFATIGEIFTALDSKIIPTFYVRTEAAALAITGYLKTEKYEDVFIESDDPAVVKAAREDDNVIRGILDCTAKYTAPLDRAALMDLRKTVNTNLCKVVVLPWGKVSAENVDWLNDRGLTTWLNAGELEDDRATVELLLSGCYGIVSSSTAEIYAVCKKYLPEGTMTRMPVNVAHRGLFEVSANKADENTLEAMIAAERVGAEMVEIDIYLTTDGYLAVNHNATTTAIYDKGVTVENCTRAQLKELRTKKYGNQMPMLDEVFEQFKDSSLRFMIEIKSQKTAIVPVLKALIDQYDYYDRCTVITFNEPIVLEMAKSYPEMPVGYLSNAANPFPSDPAEAVKYVQEFNLPVNTNYAPTYSKYDDAYVKATLKRGITTWTWTISTTGLIYEYLTYGHAGITGNRTDYLAVMPKTVTAEVNGGTVLSERIANPVTLHSFSYAGKEVRTSKAGMTVQVLSGNATASGNVVTPTGAGEVVLLCSAKTTKGAYYYTLHTIVTFTVAEPDVTGDHEMTIADASALLTALSSGESAAPDPGVDVNGDGVASVKDLARTLAYLANPATPIYPLPAA